MRVPMLDLHAQYQTMLDDIRSEIEKVFETHHYIMGAQVKEFEEKVQDYLGIKHAIGCASGTDALVLAIKALNIGEAMRLSPRLHLLCHGIIHLAQWRSSRVCRYR